MASSTDQMNDALPSNWSEDERDHFWHVQHAALPGNPVASGKGGAVSTALNGLAARVGAGTLRSGGSSVDAVLATALAQIVLGGGAVISFFGVLTMLHHDNDSGEVTSLNAGWNTVTGEDDPLSIPGSINPAAPSVADMMGNCDPSGRTALVGGFMRGLEAAHQRYGKLPFERLFDAAIELAEKGFKVTPSLDKYIQNRVDVLHRLEETRSIFFKSDDTPYKEGDHFCQPALAESLKGIAREGADYMYKGTWAVRCVEAVQREGGKMTLHDLQRYEPIWSEPISIKRNGSVLHLLGAPNDGSVHLVEALNLAKAAEIPELGHWSESAESFKRIAKCCATAASNMLLENKDEFEAAYAGIDMSRASRLTEKHAQALWQRVQSDAYTNFTPSGMHSDVVVACDKYGNMTALCHSINCLIWGGTGIVVDGISVGDPASYMQSLVAATNPGDQLPNPVQTGLISRNGKPEIAWSSMGVGLHYQTVQSLISVLDWDMSLEATVNAPRLLLPSAKDVTQRELTIRVVDGEFSDELLEETGLEIVKLAPENARFAQGLWIAVSRDPISGEYQGFSPKYTNGQAAAV